MVVEKEKRGPAVCCETHKKYRQDHHQYVVHGFDVGHETRPAHLRKRMLKQVPGGSITGLEVSAKRLLESQSLEEIRRRMVRVENPRVGPTPQMEGSEVEGHDVAFY